jgi:hypothetical protein
MGTKAYEVPLWLIEQAMKHLNRYHPHALRYGCGKETLRHWLSASGHPWAIGLSREQMRKLMVKAEEHEIVRRITQPPAIARYEINEAYA